MFVNMFSFYFFCVVWTFSTVASDSDKCCRRQYERQREQLVILYTGSVVEFIGRMNANISPLLCDPVLWQWISVTLSCPFS